MASLFKKGNGWCIQFRDRQKRRRSIPLPAMPKRSAEHVHRHVEMLIGTYIAAAPLDPETHRWLSEVGEQIHEKLVDAGLVPGRDAKAVTLRFICEQSRISRHGNKPAVKARIELAQRMLLEQFGDMDIRQFTPAHAQQFRVEQLAAGKSEATVRKRCSDARSFFNWAIKAKLLTENPFAEIPTTTTAQQRPEYVSEENARKVMEELPDARWRLLFALGRWGGVRMPSEAALLEWDDILWDRKQIRIKSMKGAADGKAERWIPMFPELVKPLQDWFDQAPEGQPRLFPGMSPTATGGLMRNVMLRAIRRSGVPAWKNLWRTLRASRQTDLNRRFPPHVSCEWLGNTPAVAFKHYMRVTEEDWERAVAPRAASKPDATGALGDAPPAPVKEQLG